MSQQEVLNFIEENPRCCTKEIIEGVNKNASMITKSLNKLVKYKEVKKIEPTIQEIDKIKRKYPNIKFFPKYRTQLKIFIVNDKRGAGLLGYLFWVGLGFALGVWMCNTLLKNFIC